MKSLTNIQIARRERILANAREELSKRGYDGLNMRDLAELAQVSTSTLYNLYQSKDALILAALQELLSDLDHRAARQELGGFEHFVLRIELQAEQIVQTEQYAKAMSTMLFNAEPDDPIVATLLVTPMDIHLRELREMQLAGQLRPQTDLESQARRLASTNWSVILLWMKGLLPTEYFKNEYRRNALLTLMPCVDDDLFDRIFRMVNPTHDDAGHLAEDKL